MKVLGYEVGKTYYNAYWRENHTIVNAGLSDDGFYWVQSLWQKGNATIHSTPRSKNDVEVHNA